MSTDTIELPKLPPIVTNIPALITPSTTTYTLQRPTTTIPDLHITNPTALQYSTGNNELDKQIHAKYTELEKKVANKHAAYTPYEDSQIAAYIQQFHGTKWTEIDTVWQQHVCTEIQRNLEQHTDVYNIYPRTSAALRSRWRTLKQAEKLQQQSTAVPTDSTATTTGSTAVPNNDSVLNAVNNTNDHKQYLLTSDNKYTLVPQLPAVQHNNTDTTQQSSQNTLLQNKNRIQVLPDGRVIRKRHRTNAQREKMSPYEQKLFAVIARHYVNHKGLLNAVKCATVCNQNTTLQKFHMNNYAASNAWPKYRHWLEKMSSDEIESFEQQYNQIVAESTQNTTNTNVTNAAENVTKTEPQPNVQYTPVLSNLTLLPQTQQ